jgi:hypothetical protein
MKLLIQKIFSHAIIISTFIIFIFYLSRSESVFLYTDNFKQKIKLISNRKSSSIILVGGSSMAFGVDSKMLYDSIGLPVINMGLQGSLGMSIPLYYVSKYLKPGDIILFAPEYDQYQNENYLGEGMTPARVILHADPEFLFYASYKELKKILPYSFPTLIEKLTIKTTNNLNLKKIDTSFNKFGDFVYHLNKKNRVISNQVFNTKIGSSFNYESISYINKINQEIKKRKGLMLISFQPILYQVGNNNLNPINKISNELRLSNIPVISIPENYFFNQNFIFEGAHHLNKKGREIRTKKLIKDLKYFLKDSKIYKI